MSKELEEYKEGLKRQLLEKDIVYKYMKARLESEKDEEMKTKIQVLVDQAERNLDDTQQLTDFVNNKYEA
jgi:hypothetical protein